MAKARMTSGLLAGCLLAWGAAPALAQPPTVPQMLNFKPRQQGVQISTPTPEEEASCKVDLERGARPGASGWVLLDGQGRKLRRFFDSNGDKKIDVWSYYKDGAEVYRETDGKLGNRPGAKPGQDSVPTEYRWLNEGGMKWGVDANEDGKIDGWKMISADELAQEVVQAAAAHDFARLRALLISEAEVRALKLPAAETDKLLKALAGAEARFNETLKKLPNLTDKAQFVRVESSAPQCVPAETTGGESDLLKHASRLILFQAAD